MLNDGEKLKRIRETLKLSQAKLAEQLGVQQTVVAMVEKGSRKAASSLKLNLLKVFNIDFDNYNEKQQILNINQPYSNAVPIPFYNVGASAGAGTWLMDEPEPETLYFDLRWLKNVLKVNPSHLNCIFASGDSMDSGFTNANSIKDGDLLLVDTSNTSGNNGIFVIRINNTELRVKRLVKKLDGSLMIISDNPKYPEEIYKPNESNYVVEVLGKVVWNGSKENV